MKKIVISVFALMFVGVASVDAQDVQVSFDGDNVVQNSQAMENFSMSEVFSSIEYNIPAPTLEINYKSNKEISSNCSECKLDETKLQNLRRKILIKSGLLKDEKALRFIDSEKIIILYNDKNIFFSKKLGENEYNIIWQSSNKQLISHLANKEKQIVTLGSTNKDLVKICKNKLVTVQILVEGVLSWVEVIKFICEYVEDNHTSSNSSGGGIGNDGLQQWPAKGINNIE